VRHARPEIATDSNPPRRRQSGVQIIGPKPEPPPLGRFQHSVRFDSEGHVVAGRGQSSELGALTAYLGRVGDLIGECLELGALTAAEVSGSGRRYLFYRDVDGCAVGLVPTSTANVQALRARLGL
jgi:hypothetical protein